MQQSIIFEFETFDKMVDLPLTAKLLLEKAITAISLSYSPYSNFKVGVAAITNKNNIVLAANQENASYGVTICAERVALSVLLSQYHGEYFTHLAVTSIGGTTNSKSKAVSPCGVCRQALFEHEQQFNHKISVILGGDTGTTYIVPCASSLLPLAFSNNDMV